MLFLLIVTTIMNFNYELNFTLCNTLTSNTLTHMSLVVRKPFFAYAKTKTQISFAANAKLISAFVFAIRIEQPLCYLNPKIQVSIRLLWLYIVQPGQCRPWSETPKTGFLTTRLICFNNNMIKSMICCWMLTTFCQNHVG